MPEKLDQINKFKKELNFLEALPKNEKIELPFMKHHSKLAYAMHIGFISLMGVGLLSEGASTFAFMATLALGFALIMSMKSHDTVVDMVNSGIQAIEDICQISQEGRVKRIEFLKGKIENG